MSINKALTLLYKKVSVVLLPVMRSLPPLLRSVVRFCSRNISRTRVNMLREMEEFFGNELFLFTVAGILAAFGALLIVGLIIRIVLYAMEFF